MRKLLLLSFAVSLILAEVNPYQYIMKQREKSNTADFNVKAKAIKPKSTGIDTYLDSVIATDLLNNIKNNPQPVSYAQKQKNLFADNIKTFKQTFSRKTSKTKTKKKNSQGYYFVGGYCRVENKVKILASDGYAELNCDLNFGNVFKQVKVFARFVPDYKREILVAFPVYAKIGNERASATGYFMNSQKSSLNVADYVDSAKIRVLLSKSLLVANDIAYKQATAYMQALEQSKQNQQVTYYNSGDNTSTPIVTTNYQAPSPKDYWSVGLVELVSSLVKLFGQNYLDNLKPLFVVNKGNMLYTEMVINENKKSLFSKFGEINKNRLKNIQKDNNLYYKELLNGGNRQ